MRRKPPYIRFQKERTNGGITVRGVAMTVSISNDAREGWHDFARSQGVSVTALAEAIGFAFTALDMDRIPARLRAAVEEARAIDAERRSRQRDPYD